MKRLAMTLTCLAALSTWPASAGKLVWTSADVDRAADYGNALTDPEEGPIDGHVTIISQGRGLWPHANDIRFCYVELQGDFEIICRITSMTESSAWAKAGLMARRHATRPHVEQVWMARTPGNGQTLQWCGQTPGERRGYEDEACTVVFDNVQVVQGPDLELVGIWA